MLKDPVCGMELSPGKVAAMIHHNGVTYSFCSEACSLQFNADPDSFVGPGRRTVTDPVCGMPFRLADMVFHREHRGREFHFCSKECYRKFTIDPDPYASPREIS